MLRLGVGIALVLVSGVAAAQAPPPTRPRLRCWQEGRLLFEETGWRALSAVARPDRVLHSADSPGAALALFDVGSATCLLERDAPARETR